MQTRPTIHSILIVLTILTVGLPLLSGCNPTTGTMVADDSPKKLPKLKFHKPKSFQIAVARLDELRQIVISDEPLPPPKRFKVVESIHGTGPGAHSHYNLAKEGASQSQADAKAHGHGHDEEESSERIHDVEVDAITEMVDIVKWLPNIAGDTDMDKTNWETVKTDSAGLHAALIETFEASDSPEMKRQTLRQLDDQIIRFTKSMSSISDQLTETELTDQEPPEN